MKVQTMVPILLFHIVIGPTIDQVEKINLSNIDY
jgi:hypothetical protein